MTSVLALVVTPPVVPTVVVIAVPLVTPLMVVISVVVGVAVVSGDGGGVGSVGTIVYTTIVNIAARRMGWGGGAAVAEFKASTAAPPPDCFVLNITTDFYIATVLHLHCCPPN